jgi:MoaA/NifB/PqqE/SkfB family radical SAM enzyme
VSTIVFTGGEPLLREDIDRLILKYSKDLSFVILTSGYGLDRERARRLKRNGLFAISISLDHYEKKINDQNRGMDGAFDIALGAIKNAKDAGLYTVIQTVATDELFQDNGIKKFNDFVENLGADELFLLEPLCTGRLFDTKRQIFLKEDKINMLKSLHSRAGRTNGTLKIITSSHIEDPKKYGCGAGTQHIYVDTAGELWPCNFLPISLGSILEEPDVVLARLNKYFRKPCSKCILKKYRQEFLNVYENKLPLSFESIEHILKRRLNDSDRPPEFFR